MPATMCFKSFDSLARCVRVMLLNTTGSKRLIMMVSSPSAPMVSKRVKAALEGGVFNFMDRAIRVYLILSIKLSMGMKTATATLPTMKIRKRMMAGSMMEKSFLILRGIMGL